jgi:Protein of unknown function (DUF1579)
MSTPATPEHRLLDIFIGRWINKGEMLATPDEPPAKIVTSDVYEWMPGGFFVLHTAYGRIGDADVGGTEIISYDRAAKVYRSHFFDSRGAITTDTLTLRDGSWIWQGERTRATSVFSDDEKTQTCLHERSDDGVNWVPAMHVMLAKVE